jgi:hypothetical protein
MLEAAIALVGIFVCWFVAMLIYNDDMSLTRYAFIALLSALALYFLIRFIHWAWSTPMLFVGRVVD